MKTYLLKKNKNCKGFTLIELLVVISLIGILMAISLVAFAQSKKSARDSKRKADLEQIRSALEIYRTDCQTYPATAILTSIFVSGGSLVGIEAPCLNQEYMSSVPNDPVSLTNSYYYSRNSTSSNKYLLCAHLETVVNNPFVGCGACGSGVVCNYGVTNP